MMLLETAVATLAGSIAKAFVTEWLGEGMAAGILTDSIDLFKESGIDLVTRRRSQRQIAKIGRQVVREITTLFEKERAGIGASGCRAVALEVGSTLSEARITAETLVSLALNSDRLYRYLRSLRPNATNLFAANEADLYESVLKQISSRIMEVASTLDGFSTVSVAATIGGQERILEGITRLVTVHDEKAKKFEVKYRDEVKRKLDRMDLLGVRRVDELHRAQSLTVSYIPLQVEGRRDAISNSMSSRVSYAPSERFVHSSPSSGGGTSINDELMKTRRVVIRGEAGSGKSTLLQWLAVRSASRDFPDQLIAWNDSVPFVIRLREHIDTGFPEPDLFPRLLGPMIAGMMPASWVYDQLEVGRALVLVDGVDELPRGQREAMLTRLSELVSAYPLVRYVVTSRPSALKFDSWPEWSTWINREGFTEVSIRPMEPEQISNFVDHWHLAVKEILADADERAEINSLAANLNRLLQQRPALRKLSTTPLLCAMICALHRERRQRLPSERIRLYEECCEMLLTGRDDVRRITLVTDYPDLGETQKWALAQSFAYWLMQNGWSDIEFAGADEHFHARLQLMSLPHSTSGSQVREFFVERTSLLREPVHGRIDFRHRTFQEFLGAQAAVREGDIGVLVKNASDDLWRELIILAAGLAGPKECERLLRGLLKRAAALKRKRKQISLLALACLETAVEVLPATRSAVLEAAAEFFPPKRVEEAPLFAAAGDPAITLLLPRPEDNEQVAAACVRTLAAIGSDASLDAIAQYGSDYRVGVKEEIGRAWNNFDRVNFASAVLKHSSVLFIDVFTSWEGFECLAHLTSLHVNQGFPLKEFAARRNDFPNLRSLYLFGLPLLDELVPVASFPNLNALSLWGRQATATDLESLEKLTNLHDLLLGGLVALSDLEPFRGMRQIKSLRLHWCTSINNIDPLSDLSDLQSLGLSGCSAINDFNVLRKLDNLYYLDLGGCNISDLEVLSGMSNLQSLSLSRCTNRLDIGALLKMESLQHVNLESAVVRDRYVIPRLAEMMQARGGNLSV